MSRIPIDLSKVIAGASGTQPFDGPSSIDVPASTAHVGHPVYGTDIPLGSLVFLGNVQASRKYKPESRTLKILGATDVVFNEISYKASDGTAKAINGLTETLDTTTYPDRAILKLYNGRGFNVYLRSVRLDGKLIYQYSGENGELIHDSLKRDDDIRRNGETVFEVGNEFIVTADQCAKIADYWYKFLGKKKHVYSLQIPGLAAWYNVGDWYNLTVGGADTNEYIDAVVECYAVDCERVAGTIGSTTLLLRDVEDSWSKTTLYAARLATGGSPKRRVNRSNIVTVASSEYDGTYDWRCDGTDDDVQIQAAIDYMSNTHGGGTVQLTTGKYTLSNTVNIKNNIFLTGAGNSTIIYMPYSTSLVYYISCDSVTGVKISDFCIDGESYDVNDVVIGIYVNGSSADVSISDISIKNLYTTGDHSALGVYNSGSTNYLSVERLRINNIESGASDVAWYAAGLSNVSMANSCIIDDITCINGTSAGIYYGRRCALNRVSNVTGATANEYYEAYADSGTTNAAADTAAGGYNS